jgi:hypothetical protein
MASRRLIFNLILFAVVLPIAQGVLYWVGLLLSATADESGALLVGRLSLICGIVWVVDLVVLLVLLALAVVGSPVVESTDAADEPGPPDPHE